MTNLASKADFQARFYLDSVTTNPCISYPEAGNFSPSH